jgi:hypothetical protein
LTYNQNADIFNENDNINVTNDTFIDREHIVNNSMNDGITIKKEMEDQIEENIGKINKYYFLRCFHIAYTVVEPSLRTASKKNIFGQNVINWRYLTISKMVI